MSSTQWLRQPGCLYLQHVLLVEGKRLGASPWTRSFAVIPPARTPNASLVWGGWEVWSSWEPRERKWCFQLWASPFLLQSLCSPACSVWNALISFTVFCLFVLSIYLAASGLSCGTWRSLWSHVASLVSVQVSPVVAWRPSCSRSRRILVPWPGIKLASSALESRLLTNGPPGKSPSLNFELSHGDLG